MLSNEKKFRISKVGGVSARKGRHGGMRTGEERRLRGRGRELNAGEQLLTSSWKGSCFVFIVGRRF